MNTPTKKPTNLIPSLFSDFFDSERFFGRDLMDFSPLRSASIPSVNIKENGKAFNIELAAPGMTKNDFKVDVEDNMLVISAEKQEEKNEENERYTRREFSYNSFSRSFRLPQEVNADNIECHYEDGLLKISVPKKEESKKKGAKTIAVK